MAGFRQNPRQNRLRPSIRHSCLQLRKSFRLEDQRLYGFTIVIPQVPGLVNIQKTMENHHC